MAFGQSTQVSISFHCFSTACIIYIVVFLGRLLGSAGQVGRGLLQQLQRDASVCCGMLVVFCRELNWHILAAALEDFSGKCS